MRAPVGVPGADGGGAAGPEGQPGPRGPGDDESESNDFDNQQPTRVRQNFVETWLWSDAVIGYIIAASGLVENFAMAKQTFFKN